MLKLNEHGVKLIGAHREHSRKRKPGFYPYFDENIEIVPLSHDMGYDVGNLDYFYRKKGNKGILLIGSGEGNVRADDELLKRLYKFKKDGRLVCLTTESLKKLVTLNYETGNKLYDEGLVIPTGNMTYPLIKMKFAAGLCCEALDEPGKRREMMENIMLTPLSGELHTATLPAEYRIKEDDKKGVYGFVDSMRVDKFEPYKGLKGR
jgi:L-asparaginase/Glu-tRNA(Gln) amidotransferase subunit D